MVTALYLGKEEIRDICVNKLGFQDNESFYEFYVDRIKNGTTDEELELLAPESVNLRHFWELCDDMLHGSICGGANKSEVPPNIGYVNYHNWSFAIQMGVLNEFLRTESWFRSRQMPIHVLEIGPGHGAIMASNYFEGVDKYYGVDVHPRAPGILQIDGSTLPEVVMEDTKISTVIASNVFQHISVAQRRHYYAQIFELLSKSEYKELSSFTFTLQVDLGQDNLIRHNDKAYITHMGMFTECQKANEVQKDLMDAGFGLRTIVSRFDGCFGFSVYMPQPQAQP